MNYTVFINHLQFYKHKLQLYKKQFVNKLFIKQIMICSQWNNYEWKFIYQWWYYKILQMHMSILFLNTFKEFKYKRQNSELQKRVADTTQKE